MSGTLWLRKMIEFEMTAKESSLSHFPHFPTFPLSSKSIIMAPGNAQLEGDASPTKDQICELTVDQRVTYYKRIMDQLLKEKNDKPYLELKKMFEVHDGSTSRTVQEAKRITEIYEDAIDRLKQDLVNNALELEKTVVSMEERMEGKEKKEKEEAYMVFLRKLGGVIPSEDPEKEQKIAEYIPDAVTVVAMQAVVDMSPIELFKEYFNHIETKGDAAAFHMHANFVYRGSLFEKSNRNNAAKSQELIDREAILTAIKKEYKGRKLDDKKLTKALKNYQTICNNAYKIYNLFGPGILASRNITRDLSGSIYARLTGTKGKKLDEEGKVVEDKSQQEKALEYIDQLRADGGLPMWWKKHNDRIATLIGVPYTPPVAAQRLPDAPEGGRQVNMDNLRHVHFRFFI